MKIAQITKEITEEDFKRLRKAKKVLPEFLYQRKMGKHIRVKDQDLVTYAAWLKEVKPKV